MRDIDHKTHTSQDSGCAVRRGKFMNYKMGEVTMSFRRLIVSIACVLVAAACSDRPSPLAPSLQSGGPHFLRLPSTAMRFEAIGAVAKPGVHGGSFSMADPNAVSVNTYE